jgi:uncharacterized protein
MPASPLRNAPKQTLPTAFHVMTKPIGPICNLDCKYCFYLEKESLYRENIYPEERKARPSWQMPDDVLETYIRQYIEQQEIPEICFAWQGGEPTLLGVRFFRNVVALQHKYANGKRILNALQTNGTLLDDEWGAFLADEQFLVGLSVDGPEPLHDAYRVDKQGRPTFAQVMRGLEVLQRHGVEYNTLTVVNRKNSVHPLEVYRFLKRIGSTFHQFIPLVERSLVAPPPAENGLLQVLLAPPPQRNSPRSPVTEWSVESEAYGRFLIAIFDEWVRNDVGQTFVQMFDVALGIWAQAGVGLCVFAPTCGTALAMEHNGDVYACDHYVYPEYRRGNIMETPLKELVAAPEQRKFGQDKSDTLPRYCRRCEVRFACNGECPKHRFLKTPDGEWGLNYLCAGYKRFFTHIAPYMQTMTQLLQERRAPAEIMNLLAQPPTKSVGRNDPCPCGSGKKYKKCCGE